MSYSFDVKNQLPPPAEERCCRKAELYGFLLFSHRVSEKEIKIVTAYPEFRARYLSLLIEAGVRNFELSCQGTSVKKYLCRIARPDDLRRLRETLDGASFLPPLRLDLRLLEKDCCRRAFLRGAFMAGGVIVSPKKNCSVEFHTSHALLGKDFFSFCREQMDLLPGTSQRNGKTLVYFKSWDSIKDFLLLIGATDAAYDLANSEIERSYRSTANRRYNCDNANIQRSVDASSEQVAAIRKLRAAGIVFSAPLEEIARLREAYPDETLSYLGQRCTPPISKAGAAHRLKKIMELALQSKGG